jgi:DNA-binding NtrC family response regulator
LRDRRIDVRVIAATNASLDEKVRQGEFRSDLLYRLNTITVISPPLRERGDDVVTIADHYLREFSSHYRRATLTFAPCAVAGLRAHFWPGNVRELRNVIEQACLFSAGPAINVEDLSLREPAPLGMSRDRGASALPGVMLNDVERELIVSALCEANGNVTLAARKLGVSRDTLRYRMEKHSLRRDPVN